jgi:hypothetical protein
MPVQNSYVHHPDKIDFIIFDGLNIDEVSAAIEAVTGDGTVAHIKPADRVTTWLLVVNNGSSDQPYVVFKINPTEAVRLNGDTGGVGLLPIQIIDTPGELIPYDSVYITPPVG